MDQTTINEITMDALEANRLMLLRTMVPGIEHRMNNANNPGLLNTEILDEVWQSIQPILDEYHQKHGDFSIAGIDYSEMRHDVPSLISTIRDGASEIKNISSCLSNFCAKNRPAGSRGIDFNHTVKMALTLLSDLLKKNTSKTTVNYSPHLPEIAAETQMCIQLAVNMIVDSCSASEGQKPEVSVATHHMENPSRVMLQVIHRDLTSSDRHERGVPVNQPETTLNTNNEMNNLDAARQILDAYQGELKVSVDKNSTRTTSATIPTMSAKTPETGSRH